jgi:mannose-6-phosphate isomerase-like protein (cupin superfamily)
MITLPPGKRTRAHVHEHHEAAMYTLGGDEMELWTGDQLQYRDIVSPGDYLFIPTNMLHVAVNRGAQSAVFIGSRSEATAQESVVFRSEMDERTARLRFFVLIRQPTLGRVFPCLRPLSRRTSVQRRMHEYLVRGQRRTLAQASTVSALPSILLQKSKDASVRILVKS